MGFFSSLFRKKTAAAPGNLRGFIDGSLPKYYTQSSKYAVNILESANRAVVKITLDMTADGSDYSDFGEGDYRNLAELEGGHLLTGCLAEPPVPTDFTLELVFPGGRSAVVERKAGADVGFLTYQGQRQQITF